MRSIEQVVVLATFGAVWVVLSVGHSLADHVIGQTDRQAAGKGAPSATDVANGVNPRKGWAACLAHVAQYQVNRPNRAGQSDTLSLWPALLLWWT